MTTLDNTPRPDARKRKPVGVILEAVPNCLHVMADEWLHAGYWVCHDCGRIVTQPLGELVTRADRLAGQVLGDGGVEWKR